MRARTAAAIQRRRIRIEEAARESLFQPDRRPPLLEELRILRGLIDLRRKGRFEAIWAENGKIFVRRGMLEEPERLKWTAAAELLESFVPRKPAGREEAAHQSVAPRKEIARAGGKR